MQNPFHAFLLRPRLLGSILFTIVLAASLPIASLLTRLLVGWCVGVAVYTALVIWRTAKLSNDALRREASRLDDSAPVILIFSVLAGVASCGAVAMLVLGSEGSEAQRVSHIVLALLTMLCGWIFVQVVFAVHYAHLYYGEIEGGGLRGGLDFPGDDEPDFWDFLYFSVTIGATSQTSDTGITTKSMRRIATVQTVYAYLFNTSVLALAVNLAAGFAQH